MLLNYGSREDFWESLWLQGDRVNPKGNQFWIFFGRTDDEAETPIFWPPDVKRWLRKDLQCWERLKEENGKENGMADDELVGWHHHLSGHEFEQALGDSEGQGEAWCTAVHSITKSQTLLSNWTTTIYQALFYMLNKLLKFNLFTTLAKYVLYSF